LQLTFSSDRLETLFSLGFHTFTFMRPVLLLFLCAIVMFTYSQQQSDLFTFGEIAAQFASPTWNNSISLLSQLNDTSTPASVNAMRKGLITIRDALDMFVFSYPYSSSLDLWAMIRKDVGKGYFLVGVFEDLINVNYTMQQYWAVRNECLAWKETFQTNIIKYDYYAYIAHPDPTIFYLRPESEFDDWYWWHSDYMPSQQYSGLVNLAQLQLGMLQKELDNYDTLLALPEVFSNDSAVQLHGYKKQLRAILTTAQFFPMLFISNFTVQLQQALNDSQTVYSALDNLHNGIVQYQFYLVSGSKQQQSIFKVVVQKGWYTMRDLLQKLAFSYTLQLLQSLTIS